MATIKLTILIEDAYGLIVAIGHGSCNNDSYFANGMVPMPLPLWFFSMVAQISGFIGNLVNQFTGKYINKKSGNHQNKGTDNRVYQKKVMEELMVVILYRVSPVFLRTHTLSD